MSTKFLHVDWATNANVYEVNTRQYTPEGTFEAFGKHITRLREMGVGILWFMPVTPISQLGRKGTLGSYYACSNYTKINPEFGVMDDFKKLVKSAHVNEMKVLIDWVANHTGMDHEWTQLHPEFYKNNEAGKLYDANGWEDVVDLDFKNVNLWKEMTDAMQFWVSECDIDGFRCDMAHLVPLPFWNYARQTLDSQKKLLWLAESEDVTYHQVFDVTYGWELLHIMESRYRNQTTLQQLVNVLHKYDSEFPTDALRLLFTSNHDENSHSGSEWERLGNGAKAFAVLCATWKNSLPLIYSGQELPNIKRLLFFDKDDIEWKGDNQLQNFYKTLLLLRKNNPALKSPDAASTVQVIDTSKPENILAYVRKNKHHEVLVLLNLTSDEVIFTLNHLDNCQQLHEVFSSELFSDKELNLEPWGYKVFAN